MLLSLLATAAAAVRDVSVWISGFEQAERLPPSSHRTDAPSLLGRHDGAVVTLVIRPDGGHAVSAGADGRLLFWSLAGGLEGTLEPLDRFDLSQWQDHAVSLAFHHYEEWIFVGTAGGAVVRFRLLR